LQGQWLITTQLAGALMEGATKNRAGICAFARWTILPALLLPASALTASATEIQPRAVQPANVAQDVEEPESIEELDEVVVSGAKPSSDPAEIIAWMRRLVGQYTYEGHVDLRGQGNSEDQRPVRGQGICVGFGPVPAVQCEIKVVWPEVIGEDGEETLGGVSTLNPAIMLFGFDPDELGVRYMTVDNNGVAEPALGQLFGDTLTSKEICASIPGNCQRVSRITAKPDLKVIDMQVDIQRDYNNVLGYRFLMRRVAQGQAEEASGAEPR
jgi:hypothetical protein